ncbi:TetR/AcrR family transcriptional regulator [Demequina globuliformis]|uniref:TetR/AcrR family transcriptional regulator n=1 Tax=Demequina globuliformis TaxID=676202 RepID=UPI000782D9C8|nr:TetR/AcrR family transcriptional regulator [Demequina globuliformis]
MARDGSEAPAPRGHARERLLAAAGELFYCGGINTTGVEAVAARAGVTKATLYNHFASKDLLVVAYLRERLEASRAGLSAEPGEVSAASQRVAALFDAVVGDIQRGDFHGCPFAKAAVEVPGNAAAMEVVQEHTEDVVRYLAVATGDGELARTIAMLYDGALIAAKVSGDAAPVERARAAAVAMVTA